MHLTTAEVGYLHERPANKADEDHEEPAGNQAESPDSIPHRNTEAVLGNPAIRRVQRTLIRGNILVCLLGVNFIDGAGGDGGRVQGDDVEGSLGAFRTILRLRNLEVPDAGNTGDPGRAKDRVGLAVQVSKVGGGWVGRE